MNAVTNIGLDGFAANQGSGSARRAVTIWRGSCLAAMARAENVVTNAVVALLPPDARLNDVHLIGRRFGRLKEMMLERGDAGVVEALARFDRWHELRRFLCHGEMFVQMLSDGHWLATFTMIRFDRSVPCRSLRHVMASGADLQLEELRGDAKLLMERLRRYATARVPLEIDGEEIAVVIGSN